MGTWGAPGFCAVFQSPALETACGIVQGMEIRTGGMGKCLGAHLQAHVIHHVKHDGHALVLFSQQQSPAFSFAAKRQAACGAAVDAHFFFHTGAYHIIVFPQGAVLIDPDFGNQKKWRYPWCPPGPPLFLPALDE